MHSICKKYKGTAARMEAFRDWTAYIHANVANAKDDWENFLLSVDETKLDDDVFAELFIKYCSLGGRDIDEME